MAIQMSDGRFHISDRILRFFALRNDRRQKAKNRKANKFLSGKIVYICGVDKFSFFDII